MRKRIIIVFIMVVSQLAASSVYADELPAPDAEALWRYITRTSPYTRWSFWPDHQGMQPGRAPHGPLHKVYVNNRLLHSLNSPVQYGSIQVKENYNKNEKLLNITVMYKVRGYNPQDGDWFWVKYTPDGKAGPVGKPDGCIGCHGTRARNDFILVHDFK